MFQIWYLNVIFSFPQLSFFSLVANSVKGDGPWILSMQKKDNNYQNQLIKQDLFMMDCMICLKFFVATKKYFP
jgi:hypothetical protein